MAALIIVIYLMVPIPSGDDSVWFLIASLVVCGLIYMAAAAWATLRITKSSRPVSTGVVSLAVMVTALVVVFALAYVSLSMANPDNFNVPLDKISALYFTMTILSTVGFGDIHAQTHLAMILVMIQMVVGLTLLTVVVRVLMTAIKYASKKKVSGTSH